MCGYLQVCLTCRIRGRENSGITTVILAVFPFLKNPCALPQFLQKYREFRSESCRVIFDPCKIFGLPSDDDSTFGCHIRTGCP